MEQKQEPDQKIPGPPTHRLAPAHDSKVTCYSRLRARAHTHTYADTLSNTCTHVHVHAHICTHNAHMYTQHNWGQNTEQAEHLSAVGRGRSSCC